MNAKLRNGAVFLLLVISIVLPGCSQHALDEVPEDTSSAEVADTANVEAPASIESLPPADPNAGGVPANPEAVPQEPVAAADSLATPEPAPAPVTDSGSGENADYTVETGDTLMKIAFKVYGDIFKWQSIYNLNRDKITDANVLTAGMQLKYEKPAIEPSVEKNGDPYMIKTGDTLGTIANDIYGKSAHWKKLWENNKTLIKDPNRIYTGFYIYYQITEEERQEAERIKGGRAGGQTLGESTPPTGGGMDSLINSDPSNSGGVPAQGSEVEGTHGLNNLAAPAKGRVPASKR